MVTAASIAIIMAFLFGTKFLRSLIVFLGALMSYGYLLTLLFGGINNVIAGLACCLFVVFLWIYVHAKEEREQKEQEEQKNIQSNLT